MHRGTTILAFSGSSRTDSVNKRLVRIAASGAREAGASVTLIDLRNFQLPLYDGDLEAEEGIPAPALELRKLIATHRGLLIASPEHNNSVSAALKNALDWLSRPLGEEPSRACFAGKAAALVSGSLGPIGGLRSQAHLRQILNALNVHVIPDHYGVAWNTPASFDAKDDLIDRIAQDRVRAVGAALARFLAAWAADPAGA